MIVVDSSVWIDVLHNRSTAQALKFFAVEVLGDIILRKSLQGAQNDNHAANLQRRLKQFAPVAMLSPAIAIKAASNYRFMRGRAKTVSKIPDLIIGTYCIENGHSLLQQDKDYLPMAEHLGLQLA